MEKFDILSQLNNEFKQRVKILYIFEDQEYIEEKYVLKGYNVFIVTKDEKTYAFGNNTFGQLGFGHNRVVCPKDNQLSKRPKPFGQMLAFWTQKLHCEVVNAVVNAPQIVKELCDQQIVDFANGLNHCIARNNIGKVYCWGRNKWGLIGTGQESDSFHKPILNQYLNNEFITDISCGAFHSIVLTNCGEVYAWGSNRFGQIGNACNSDQLMPIKMKGFNNERVVMISCGLWHSMALTESGRVYSWGRNDCGQLGIGTTGGSNEPKFVAVIDEIKFNVFIEKISCGSYHSLLLSSDGYIYAFGRNQFGELGNQKEGDELSPHRIKIETKFIYISSHWDKYISIALAQNGIYYNWGKCGEEIIRTPKPTNFKSFVEIYAKYLKTTHKAIHSEDLNSVPILLREQENILKTQIRLEEENGEKVKANKTEYNLKSSVNRFNSQPNQTLSRYKSDFKESELIGRGGFGSVFKVFNRLDRQQYAVKKISLRGIYKSNSHHL